LFCQGPDADPEYNDRALGDEGVASSGGDDAATGSRQPKWQQQLQLFDVFTAYRPFTIIDYYFQPYSTGPSLAWLLASVIIIIFYATTVFTRGTQVTRLVRFQSKGEAEVLPTSGVGLLTRDDQDLLALGNFSVQWEKVTRSFDGTKEEVVIESLTSSNCGGAPEFMGKTCVQGRSMKNSLGRAIPDSTQIEIRARIIGNSNIATSELSAQFENALVKIAFFRYDQSSEFQEFLADGIEEINIYGRSGITSEVDVVFAIAEWDRKETPSFFSEDIATVCFFRGFYETQRDLDLAFDDTYFSISFRLEDLDFRTKLISVTFSEQIGTVCGVAAALYVIGSILRWYNKYHFRAHGAFEDANVEQSFLRHFLHTEKNYTPPGIKELADENLSDTKRTQKKTDDIVKLSKQVRRKLKKILKTRKDEKDALRASKQSSFKEASISGYANSSSSQ